MGDPSEVGSGRAWEDQRSIYDALRTESAVSHDDDTWIVLRHAEVASAATDPRTFSSKVTTRRAIPNSLDGAEHASFRAVVDRYLTGERVDREESQCRKHAAAIVDALPRGVTVKTIASIGIPYAVRTQSSWLGWPPELEDELVGWIQDNHAATRSGNRHTMSAVAERFDHMIRALLEKRQGQAVTCDVTSELLGDSVDGRPLTTEEIVSILRNWTAGDLGSLATSVGVIVHFLASTPEIQREVRALVEVGDHAALSAAAEEILRIDDPFVSNRRVATRPVSLGGEDIPGGCPVVLNWTAANRDPLVFGDPDRYDPAGNADANLVFGVGPHVCPGRALTLMELRVIIEELLIRTTWIEPAADRPAVRETPPVGGWACVPVVLR
ncbi:cytochrome P450 [Aeromicrobium sp.]|uniref:cytochrome P450 n=1 Tax=Aeromicrobium sp. TaxID=1871063 RepID=UPI0019B1A097|nr:cytochrome P450 [Aeromicrobium sp.]MBC7633709.1 cytochrome P450 [Aeromicrobium sp.]